MKYFRKLSVLLLLVLLVSPPDLHRKVASRYEMARAHDPDHTHSELYVPERYATATVAISASGSTDVPIFGQFGWEQAANLAVRGRYEYLRARTHLARSVFGTNLNLE